MDATKLSNLKDSKKDALFSESDAAAADFDTTLASSPDLLADMIRDKAGEAFAAHPYTMGSPDRIGVFVGTVGFGDPAVLSLFALEEMSEEQRAVYPGCAECALTIAQARVHGIPIKTIASTRMADALLRFGALSETDLHDLKVRAAARRAVAPGSSGGLAVVSAPMAGGASPYPASPFSPTASMRADSGLSQRNVFAARGALTPGTPSPAPPEGPAAGDGDASGNAPEAAEFAAPVESDAVVVETTAATSAAAVAAREAALAAAGADIGEYRSMRVGDVKEGREAAIVAELRRDTTSLLTRVQRLVPRFVELIADGPRSQLVGLDGFAPALLFALKAEIVMQSALLAMARLLVRGYVLSKGVGGARLQAGISEDALDDTLMREVVKGNIVITNMSPLERAIGFPPVGGAALAVFVSRFTPQLDFAADAGLRAALMGKTLLANGRFEPAAVVTALSAKLGVIDKYSLQVDVHETMLYLIQITGAAAAKTTFLLRKDGERAGVTLADWAHELGMNALLRRRGNKRFERGDLDGYRKNE